MMQKMRNEYLLLESVIVIRSYIAFDSTKKCAIIHIDIVNQDFLLYLKYLHLIIQDQFVKWHRFSFRFESYGLELWSVKMTGNRDVRETYLNKRDLVSFFSFVIGDAKNNK